MYNVFLMEIDKNIRTAVDLGLKLFLFHWCNTVMQERFPLNFLKLC